MPDAPIRVERRSGIAWCTLDRPPLNLIDPPLIAALREAFDDLARDPGVRAAVLTGAGRAFTAGMNVHVLRGLDAVGARSLIVSLCGAIEAVHKAPFPVIAAVNGPALGAGFGLAASCDIIVASENAVFGLPEIDVGLMGGGKHTSRIVPHSLARRMMLTGYRAPASEMYRRGIIEACLPVDELLPYCLEMAAVIASKSPLATRYAKDSMRTIENMTLRDGYIYEQGNTAKLSTSYDAQEAVAAFVEKRAPVFQGR